MLVLKQMKWVRIMFKYFKQLRIQMQYMLKINFVLIVFVAGCYSDRLPEEIDHLGVPRVSALEVEAIAPVTLRPPLLHCTGSRMVRSECSSLLTH